MFPYGSRFFFTLSVVSLVAAGVYGLASGGDVIGVISLGYKGGVGSHLGYTVLVWTGVAATVIGTILVVVQDADPPSVADVDPDALPEVPAPRAANYWPAVAAFGAATLVLGLVTGPLLFVTGAVVLVAAGVEWTVRAWSDRATGDPEVNRAIRNRLMMPIEIPVAAVAVIGFVVFGMSRVFLALSATGAVVAATVVSTVVLVAAIVVAVRPRVANSVVGALLVIGAAAVLAGGIAGVVAGEREFEEHGEEHGEEHTEETDEPSAEVTE